MVWKVERLPPPLVWYSHSSNKMATPPSKDRVPTVDLYKLNDVDDIGAEVSVIVFDARRTLTEGQLSELVQKLTKRMPFGVYDGIHDPPQFFATGVAFKHIDPDLEPGYLPHLRTLFTKTLSSLA